MLRIATFNASRNRATADELVADLSTPDDPQAVQVAEVIQLACPDVLDHGRPELRPVRR